MQVVRVKCPECSAVLDVKNRSNSEQKQIKCPRCGHQLVVQFSSPKADKGSEVRDKELEDLEKAIEINRRVLGIEHAVTANSYMKLSMYYLKKHNYHKALQYAEEALLIQESVLGKEHLDTATSYHIIGHVHRKLCNYDKALEFFKKAFAIRKKVLTLEHPDTENSYNAIIDIAHHAFKNASLYHSSHDYAKALEELNKALEILMMFEEKELSDIASIYHSIGIVCEKFGDIDKAIENFDKSYDIRKKVLEELKKDKKTTS